jgi:hypothetical protein
MPWISFARAAILVAGAPASRIQSARQLRQNPARPIRSMFWASWRWRKWRTSRRKGGGGHRIVQRIEWIVGGDAFVFSEQLMGHFLGLCGPLCHRAGENRKGSHWPSSIRARAQGEDSRHAGPGQRSPEMIERLLRAGADAFRVNMSHGDHATHAETIAAIRAVEKKHGAPGRVLCDLQGPKLRVGQFRDGRR